MKKYTVCNIAIIVIISFSLAFAGQTTGGNPKSNLLIPKASFNFGYTPQNSKLSHTYWLYSTGTDTLKIVDVKPGCGCTKAPLSRTELAPGDSTALEVIYSTKTYAGPQSKRPRITTNMGPKPSYVMFTANVVSNGKNTYPIQISPYKFDISQLGRKERTTMKFEIENVGDKPIEISLIDFPHEMFEIKLPGRIKPGENEMGELRLKDDFKNIEFEKSVTIELNDPDKTRFTVPIKRVIRALSSASR